MLRRRFIPGCTKVVVLLCAATFANAADDTPTDDLAATQAAKQKALELIGKLGDSSFSVRRNATRELIAIGLPALDALRQASQADDLEVRYRAGRLFQGVRLKVHAERLEKYLADPESISQDKIPGLTAYQEIAGTDEAARKLFVEMQRAEADLFVLLDGDRKKLEESYNNRALVVRYLLSTTTARKQIPATTAALMFLGTQPELTVTDRAVGAIYGLANYQEFRSALTSKNSVFRKIVGHWIATETAGAAQQRLILALRYNLSEGLGLALTTIKAPANSYELQYALFTIGRFGGSEQIPAVEALFQNKGVLTRVRAAGKNKSKFTAQIRDVALAVATHMLGKDPKKELGFPRLSRNSQYLFNPNSAGFNDEASRTAAFKKWDEWQAAAKKKAVEKPSDGAKSGK